MCIRDRWWNINDEYIILPGLHLPRWRKNRVVFWLLVTVIAFGFVNLGFELNYSTFSWGYYEGVLGVLIPHRDDCGFFHYRMKNEGMAIFVGLLVPIALFLLAILIEPVVLRRLEDATRKT